MIRSGVTRSMWAVVLAGALVALGSGPVRAAIADDSDLTTPPYSHPSDDLGATPAVDTPDTDTPDHFDNGPVPGDVAASDSPQPNAEPTAGNATAEDSNTDESTSDTDEETADTNQETASTDNSTTDEAAAEECPEEASSAKSSAMAELGTEDTATEQPDRAPAEQPVTEESSAGEPATGPLCPPPPCEEPAVQECPVAEPTAQEPATREPAAQEPTTQERTAEESTMEEPTTGQTNTEEPTAQEPTTEKANTEEPTTEEANTQEGTTEEPAPQEPAVQDPAAHEPDLEQGTMDRPAGDETYLQQPTECPVGNAVESGLELFRRGPDELLAGEDQKLLRTLETLSDESSGRRRTALNDYLQDLGMEAVAFSRRFEEATGIEAAGLADDLPGAAALLGSYRLIERGELGMEEGVDLLRRSLKNLSPDWIDGVRTITADASHDAYGDPSTPVNDQSEMGPATLNGKSLLDVLGSMVLGSVRAVGQSVWNASASLSQSDWLRVIYASMEGKTANQGGADRF